MQSREDVEAGGGDVGDAAGLDLGDPQRRAVGGGQELHVPAEGLVLLTEPPVVAVLAHAGDPVRFDQRAVEDHMGHAVLAAALQDFVQVGGSVGEDVDALVQVAVTGGLRDPSIVGQAVHAAALAEPAQHQHRLPERAQGTGPPRSADPAAVRGQQAGEELDGTARDVEHGGVGDHGEASGSADDRV